MWNFKLAKLAELCGMSATVASNVIWRELCFSVVTLEGATVQGAFVVYCEIFTFCSLFIFCVYHAFLILHHSPWHITVSRFTCNVWKNVYFWYKWKDHVMLDQCCFCVTTDVSNTQTLVHFCRFVGFSLLKQSCVLLLFWLPWLLLCTT
jgi:hypothetical protein